MTQLKSLILYQENTLYSATKTEQMTENKKSLLKQILQEETTIFQSFKNNAHLIPREFKLLQMDN